MVNWPVQSSADQFKTKGDFVIRQKNYSMQQFSYVFLFVSLYLSAFFPSPPAFSLALASISIRLLSIQSVLDFAEVFF